MTPRVDCHTHTELSGHGIGTVDEVVEAAVAAGLETVVLTEHLALPSHMDSARELSMDPHSLAGYVEAIQAAREKYPQIEVVAGLEVDWIDGNSEYELADLTGITHILGSVHFIDGWAFDDPNSLDEWERRDVDQVWRDYFKLWCAAVSSDIPFDVMAHPDLPKKFGHRPAFDTAELFAEVARRAAEAGVAIEVNAAGLRKPVGELYPSHDLLVAFNHAGVEIMVGSDAHAPAEVGMEIEKAYEAARAAGYTRVAVPTLEGGRRYIEL